VRSAASSNQTPAELVALNGAEFRRLAAALDISYDDFIHTASDPRHVPAVHALWARCAAAGDVYRKSYRGWYCVGCEQFLRESEIVDGACPVHLAPLELLDEENWFFRLSRYQEPMLEAVRSDRLEILPKERKNEVCQFIVSGLEDFSISRSRARAKGWGVPVPGDDTQIVYVWFDALANYLSVLGYPNGEAFGHYWQNSSARCHVIGKDILRFHAVYWPAILLSAGLPLPTALRAHGFITNDGKKIGKSLGNAVDPFRLAAKYGVDALRYYLLAHLHTTKDSDFREDLLRTAYSSELAGKLGNLLQRVCALCVTHSVEIESDVAAIEANLVRTAADARSNVERAVTEFALHDALRAIFELVSAANRYVDSSAPWQLGKRTLDQGLTPAERASASVALRRCLSSSVHALLTISDLLDPFLPSTASAVRARLRPNPSLGPALFPPFGDREARATLREG
jgi:methionyl-tRNA synthetase